MGNYYLKYCLVHINDNYFVETYFKLEKIIRYFGNKDGNNIFDAGFIKIILKI